MIPGITVEGEVRETIATTNITAMSDTTAMSGTTGAEETTAAGKRKSRIVTSMAKIKAIGRMNAPSPERAKKSLIGSMLSRRSQ